jgi:hypothetical protein
MRFSQISFHLTKIGGDVHNFVYIVSANDTGDKLFTGVND